MQLRMTPLSNDKSLQYMEILKTRIKHGTKDWTDFCFGFHILLIYHFSSFWQCLLGIGTGKPAHDKTFLHRKYCLKCAQNGERGRRLCISNAYR